MVLPVQQVAGVRGDVDAELAFGLKERGAGVTWILPGALDSALARSPGLQASTRGLPVAIFLQAEVRRVGDPLFGDLLRLGALANSEMAVLPVRAALEATEAGDPVVRLWAALVHVRSGRVLWYGIVEGEPGEARDPRTLASAVDALARGLLGEGGGG